MAKEKNSKDKNTKQNKRDKEEKEKEKKEEEEEMEKESEDEGEEVVKFPEAEEEEFDFQLDTTTHDKATMALESGQKTPELNLEGFLQDVNIEKKEKKEKEQKPQDLYSTTSADTGYITGAAQEDSWEKQQMQEVRETIKPQVILEETRHVPRVDWKPITGEASEFREITKYEEKYKKIGGDIHRPGFAREDRDKQNIKKYKAIRA